MFFFSFKKASPKYTGTNGLARITAWTDEVKCGLRPRLPGYWGKENISVKILIWATSFGADLWSLARFLDGRSDVELKIVMNDPQLFLQEGIAKLYPLQSQIIERRFYHQLIGIPGFKADVTIMDNWVPFRPPSPRGFMLWHGFGWKGPNDVREFAYLHHCIKRTWGSSMKSNRNFRWHTFGPWDFEHRTTISGFHPENCRQVGAASHDYLLSPVAREKLQPFYPFDVITRKTILFAPTWHYGKVFSHWGDDSEIMNRLLQECTSRDANVIIRLHDSFRYDKKDLSSLKALSASHKNVLIKFKDSAPDNILDMQVSDVLMTNFSSIANLYYATRRPTIHIYPVANADEEFMWRRYTPLGTVKKKITSVKYIWKLPPEDNGGLLAHSLPILLEQIGQALDDPDCCKEKVEDFLKRHMLGGDGRTCQRIWEVLTDFVSE